MKTNMVRKIIQSSHSNFTIKYRLLIPEQATKIKSQLIKIHFRNYINRIK